MLRLVDPAGRPMLSWKRIPDKTRLGSFGNTPCGARATGRRTLGSFRFCPLAAIKTAAQPVTDLVHFGFRLQLPRAVHCWDLDCTVLSFWAESFGGLDEAHALGSVTKSLSSREGLGFARPFARNSNPRGVALLLFGGGTRRSQEDECYAWSLLETATERQQRRVWWGIDFSSIIRGRVKLETGRTRLVAMYSTRVAVSHRLGEATFVCCENRYRSVRGNDDPSCTSGPW
jgi:hypothetical protein